MTREACRPGIGQVGIGARAGCSRRHHCHPAFFDSPNLFWATLGVVALLICATLMAARRLRWI